MYHILFPQDEVKSESTFTICIGSYQLDNGEHRYNAYDFPVMLINKPDKQRELDYDCFKQPSEDNVNRLVEQSGHDSSMAAKIITNVLLSQFHQFGKYSDYHIMLKTFGNFFFCYV